MSKFHCRLSFYIDHLFVGVVSLFMKFSKKIGWLMFPWKWKFLVSSILHCFCLIMYFICAVDNYENISSAVTWRIGMSFDPSALSSLLL